jgi:predicted SAM-dependent methyltransferase
LIKLHLGCGKISLPGYVNVDIQNGPGVDMVADLRQLPWSDGTIDMVYSCAAIEHFGRREWIGVLREWARVLKPGGLLRLSTADFDAVVARYLETGNLPELLGLLIGGQKDDYDWHGMIFNFNELSQGLREAGFGDVRRYNWKETDIGSLGIDDYSQAYLPHMDKQNGRLMMLNVEATRIVEGRKKVNV